MRRALARARGSGEPAPEESAPNSRLREMAIWISMAAIGARISHQQRGDRVAALVVVAHGDEDGQVRDPGDHGADGGGHRRDQDVAVLHVRQLVGEHALQLAAGRGWAGCPGSPRPRRARGCGRWRRRSAADLGRRTAAASGSRPCRPAPGRSGTARGTGPRSRARPGGADGDLVRVEVGDAVHHDGQDQHDRDPVATEEGRWPAAVRSGRPAAASSSDSSCRSSLAPVPARRPTAAGRTGQVEVSPPKDVARAPAAQAAAC